MLGSLCIWVVYMGHSSVNPFSDDGILMLAVVVDDIITAATTDHLTPH